MSRFGTSGSRQTNTWLGDLVVLETCYMDKSQVKLCVQYGRQMSTVEIRAVPNILFVFYSVRTVGRIVYLAK